MSSPWTPAKELDAYRHGLDYRIEDKLDRLRAVTRALAAIALADEPTGAQYIHLIGTIRALETTEERHEVR